MLRLLTKIGPLARPWGGILLTNLSQYTKNRAFNGLGCRLRRLDGLGFPGARRLDRTRKTDVHFLPGQMVNGSRPVPFSRGSNRCSKRTNAALNGRAVVKAPAPVGALGHGARV